MKLPSNHSSDSHEAMTTEALAAQQKAFLAMANTEPYGDFRHPGPNNDYQEPH